MFFFHKTNFDEKKKKLSSFIFLSTTVSGHTVITCIITEYFTTLVLLPNITYYIL